MDIGSLSNSKKLSESEDDVITQVQQIMSDGSDSLSEQYAEHVHTAVAAPSEISKGTTTGAGHGSAEKEEAFHAVGRVSENQLLAINDDAMMESAQLPQLECHGAAAAARQDTAGNPEDITYVPSDPSPDVNCSDCLNDDITDSQPSISDIAGSHRTAVTATDQLDTADPAVSQQSVQARLREAIDKVEQLDRSLEKKLKENMEARAVTADLRALVRRELAELTGARQPSREEADNTLQFLRALVDNDSESETSGRVTPIFQTQVRFGRGAGPPCADPGPQETPDSPAELAAGEPPSPPSPPTHQAQDQYFIRRNIELAQEAGGSLAMTEQERRRLEQLLTEDDDSVEMTENAFSVDQELISEIDQRLGSLFGGPDSSAAGSASLMTPPGGGGCGDAVHGAEGTAGEERDYLEVTRQDRETAARLEALQRRLEMLAEPVEVRPLDRSTVDAMLQETIAYLVSTPAAGAAASHSELSGAGGSAVSGRGRGLEGSVGFEGAESAGEEGEECEVETGGRDGTETGDDEETKTGGCEKMKTEVDEDTETEDCEETKAGRCDGTETADGDVPETCEETKTEGCEVDDSQPEGRVGAVSPRPASEVASEATLDLRSVLSGDRLCENERHLAAELRPGSPTAWLVDVTRGQQKLQLVVPRLSRQLIASLLEGSSVLPQEREATPCPSSDNHRPASAAAAE